MNIDMESVSFQLAINSQPRALPLNTSPLAFVPSVSPSSLRSSVIFVKSRKCVPFIARARKDNAKQESTSVEQSKPVDAAKEEEEEYEEVEISWLQEKAENVYESVGAAVNAIPGPRVGSTSLPWLLAVPIGYLGITFIIAVVKTVVKFNSPKAKRRRLVDKNAFLCTTINDTFAQDRLTMDNKKLDFLKSKTGFTVQEILRKYLRYALNERPFNPDLVANLIHLRKVSELEDSEVIAILNDVSRRIVKEKGPVLMDTRGLTEKGVKRKAAVQALFAKLLYLSELEEFCQITSRGELQLKEIFGVTDEDANSIRIETLSDVGDVESLEKMVPSDEKSTEKQED
ncbi:hypothetical protein KP509_03G050800 [Ceratopteris richardii]|uniref:Armadillo-like repeats domain-containing protein n=1 Tax=Ceratopteris richardii TaxID=49495 RepID=A0A8T2V3Y4_CERRI|nr:hypothetical protein KP509_03G050800 [Ceratopteris richardii]